MLDEEYKVKTANKLINYLYQHKHFSKLNKEKFIKKVMKLIKAFTFLDFFSKETDHVSFFKLISKNIYFYSLTQPKIYLKM